MALPIRLLLFTIILFWVLGFFLQFFIPYFNILSFIYPFTNELYSTVCHQQTEKLLSFSGNHTLVCARCSGIYLGGLLSALLLIFITFKKVNNGKLIILAALPMLVDVLLYSVGIYVYSKIIALFTGVLFGSVGIVYIYNGFQILLEKND